jgi:hypothetical protein
MWWFRLRIRDGGLHGPDDDEEKEITVEDDLPSTEQETNAEKQLGRHEWSR